MAQPRRRDRLFIALALIIVVAVAAAVASHHSTPPKSVQLQPAPLTGSALATDCMKSYNDKVLCKFAVSAADINKLAYTATDTLTDSQGQSRTEAIQNDGQGGISVVTTDKGQVSSVVQLGNTVYFKQSSADTWYKFTSNKPANNNPANSLKPNFSSSKTPASQKIHYKSLGTEACGSLTCYKYQITRAGAPGTITEVWFDNVDYRIQHWHTQSANGSDDFVITYAPVEIPTPSPVADVPAPPSN